MELRHQDKFRDMNDNITLDTSRDGHENHDRFGFTRSPSSTSSPLQFFNGGLIGVRVVKQSCVFGVNPFFHYGINITFEI